MAIQIRSTSHILNWQTDTKSILLDQMFSDYSSTLKEYINLILTGKLPLKLNLSSADLPEISIKSAAWKQIVYKTASEIIRSQIKKANTKRYKRYKQLYYKASKSGRRTSFLSKCFSELKLKDVIKSKYFTIPNLNNYSIALDQRLVNFNTEAKSFDEFVQISSTVRDESKKRDFLKVRLPIKHYKHSLKYKNDESWTRKKTIILRKVGKKFFLDFIYEKESVVKKASGKVLGLDQGYKKLLSDSDGVHYGSEMFQLYQRISRKKQGSKSFKRLLKHRDDEINRICNTLDVENIRELIIEDLKYVKQNSKLFHTVMNKVQRWSYARTAAKLERLCEENGVLLTKVNPAYTSQTCSNCGVVDKASRSGEQFSCQHCGYSSDADTNAAKNILRIGVCGPYGSKEDTTSLG